MVGHEEGTMRRGTDKKGMRPLGVFLLFLIAALRSYIGISCGLESEKIRNLGQMQTRQARDPLWWQKTQTAAGPWWLPLTPGATPSPQYGQGQDVLADWLMQLTRTVWWTQPTATPTSAPLHTLTPVLRASPPAGKAPEPSRHPTATGIEQGAEDID
jgi:hypothetical protein